MALRSTLDALISDEERSRRGVVVGISDDGCGYVRAADAGDIYVFTFDQIRGYSDETVAEMRAGPGTQIEFWLDHSGKLATVEIPFFA